MVVGMTPLLEIKGVHKNFGGVVALDGIDLSLAAGDLACIIGPNGCGKTTLLNVVSGAFPPDAGEVWFRGENISGLSPHRIARKGIGRKFQVPGIYPALTVAENLEVPLTARPSARRWHFARHERLSELLKLIQLADKAQVFAAVLAHGEKQWLEIGMLLASDTELILLDEPTAGMTITETERTADLIRQVSESARKTILAIEHDMNFVRRLECRVMVMMRGRAFREGSFADVQADPDVRKAYLGEAMTC
jgi:urea ABC transporter ATP-binding protein UrtD